MDVGNILIKSMALDAQSAMHGYASVLIHGYVCCRNLHHTCGYMHSCVSDGRITKTRNKYTIIIHADTCIPV